MFKSMNIIYIKLTNYKYVLIKLNKYILQEVDKHILYNNFSQFEVLINIKLIFVSLNEIIEVQSSA